MTPREQYWIEHCDDCADDNAFRSKLAGLKEYLSACCHLHEATVPEEANVWVYVHGSREIQLSTKQVESLTFPRTVDTVLLLQPGSYGVQPTSPPDGRSVRVLAWDTSETETIARLLSAPPPVRGRRPEMIVVGESGLKSLLEAAIGFKWNPDRNWSDPRIRRLLLLVGRIKGLDSSARAAFATLVLKRLNPYSDRGLREALLLLTDDEAASQHETLAALGRPFDDSDGDQLDPGEQLQVKRFLDFCADLHEAISTPAKVYTAGHVLILDDRPDNASFRPHCDAVAEHLLRCFGSIDIDNPLEPNEDLFRFFTDYQTLGAGPAGSVERRVEDLKAKIQRAHFVLVDQLFKLGSGSEYRGAQFIRGLIRWMNDNRRAVSRDGRVPEVIALSRTDEPRIIQDALRAGAKDYILKSRFTSLPAVLARVARGSADAVPPLHQNFRQLYNLPNETIGLLQTAFISPIKFHDRTAATSLAEEAGKTMAVTAPSEERPDKISRSAPEWANLLRRLPKTDLHVHAGSVMSREFLTLASLVMLVSRPLDPPQNGSKRRSPEETLPNLIAAFHGLLDAPGVTTVSVEPSHRAAFGPHAVTTLSLTLGPPGAPLVTGQDWFVGWGRAAKRALGSRLRSSTGGMEASLRDFRAYLHRDLDVRDYLSPADASRKLDEKNDLEVAFYLLRHATKVTISDGRSFDLKDLVKWAYEDLVRIYLLVLASRYDSGRATAVDSKGRNLLTLFGHATNDANACDWTALSDLSQSLFPHDSYPAIQAPARRGRRAPASPERVRDSNLSVKAFASRGWAANANERPPLTVNLGWIPKASEDSSSLDFKCDPIGYTLATGTRSRNLTEYLLGCEFSGAEHLKHPFLIHVYSRQVLMDWVRQGVMYAELKASPDGYAFPEIGFEYPAAVQCLIQAFSQAQYELLNVYKRPPGEALEWGASALGPRYSLERLRRLILTGDDVDAPVPPRKEKATALPFRLPCKTSLVFVGKRHKSLREMILEAAGAAVMRPPGENPADSAKKFVEHEFTKCRVVGFDLAGKEQGHPPAEFAQEFGRLSRLHLPITVHAGENAAAQFIEDAVIELGAARIGHGLALAEDRRLLARLRDDRIAIELCPVCNHQTSQFHRGAQDGGRNRPYPLEDYLRNGLYVSINTDNPIISDTDMVREFFQASWAFGADKGLSLWDALRIIRMGFVSCFLNLEERRHMLELSGQYLFDLFSDPDIVDSLRELAE